MKSTLSWTIALLCVSLFSACSPQEVVTMPAPAPTLAPSVETSQPVSVPAAATVTFEGTSCAYDGPQTLPASETLTVEWRIATKSGDIYSLRPFLANEAETHEDLMQALSGLDAQRPVLPAGLTEAGSFLSVANRTLEVTVKSASGPLHGLLYFSCWDSDRAFDVLGPIELK